MLDADSVFERLLREAANLVPKMSTPKLTNALKVTSSLQQKITETVASRLQQERSSDQFGDSVRQVSLEGLFTQGVIQDNIVTTSEANDHLRRATCVKQLDGSYSGVAIFPQFNHLVTNSKDGSDVVVSSDITSISYPTGTLLSPMNTVTAVMSGNTSMGGCGALLLPLVASNHGTAIFQSNPVMTTASSHLSIVADPSMLVSSSGNLTGHSFTFNPATNTCGTNPQLTNSPSVHNTSIKMDTKNETGNSGRNTQLRNVKNSMELKQEPLDCFGRLTSGANESLLATSSPVDLHSAVGFSQLPPIAPFGSPTTMSLNSNVSNASLTISRVGGGLMNTQNSDVGCSSANEVVPTSTSKSTSGGGPYRCRDCDKEFRILRYLEKHRRIHTGEKPYQCCYCGRQFNDWPNMNRHKRIHTGERPYRCAVCTKTFSQPAVYNEHVKRHTGERPFICSVCAKGFPRAARLAVHMRVHTGERPYPCTSCDRRFSQPHHLAAHLRVHSGDRPYSCQKCDVSFACISNLRRHKKQVHPTSPLASDSADRLEMKSLTDEKKPSLQCLAAASSVTETISSSSGLTIDVSPFLATSSTLTADTPMAFAAAMSGTVLTATGALVPANFLPNSSIPGLILTSAAPGTLIAAPANLTEQHSHLHPALIGHNSGSATTMLASSMAGGLGSLNHSSASLNSSSIALGAQSEALLKGSSSSSTLSFMFPTVLTSTPQGDGLRPTPVAFLTSTGELDRSCTALATAGPDGSLVVNPVSGDTVYLEPLDPRITLEPGHQFTLTTIPTSHTHGHATILNPHAAGAQLLGHQIQLQPGSHIAHITTNLPGQTPQGAATAHLLGPNTALFSAAAPGCQGTVIFSSPTAICQHTPQQSQSVLQSVPESITPSQLLHYHRPTSVACSLPGRPASTPTQQQAAMLVPIVHTPPVSATSNAPLQSSDPGETSNNTLSSTVSWSTSVSVDGGAFVSLNSSHLCPVSTSTSLHEDHMESVSLANSRPSSVLSNSSSLSTLANTSVPETSL